MKNSNKTIAAIALAGMFLTGCAGTQTVESPEAPQSPTVTATTANETLEPVIEEELPDTPSAPMDGDLEANEEFDITACADEQVADGADYETAVGVCSGIETINRVGAPPAQYWEDQNPATLEAALAMCKDYLVYAIEADPVAGADIDPEEMCGIGVEMYEDGEMTLNDLSRAGGDAVGGTTPDN